MENEEARPIGFTVDELEAADEEILVHESDMEDHNPTPEDDLDDESFLNQELE